MAGRRSRETDTQSPSRGKLYLRGAAILFIFNIMVWTGTLLGGEDLGEPEEIRAVGVFLSPLAAILVAVSLMIGANLMNKVQGSRVEPRPWQLALGVDQTLGYRVVLALIGIPTGLIAFIILGLLLI